MDNPKYAVVIVHGICDKRASQQKGFSKELRCNVFPNFGENNPYWREAIWEKVTEAADDKIQDIVLTLVNAYNKTEYWLDAELKKRRSAFGRFYVRTKWLFGAFARWLSVNKLTQALDLLLDLPLYMGDPRGRRVREIVLGEIKEALKQTPEGVILVGHSLGSVIAYDVVREVLKSKDQLPIKALVTFGSPLDWITKLRVADGDLEGKRFPIGNVRWYNYFDPKDPVCLMQELSEGLFQKFEKNEPTRSDFYGVAAHTAYWRNPKIAAIIRNLTNDKVEAE